VNGAHVRSSSLETSVVEQGSQDLTGVVIDVPGNPVLDAFQMDVDVARSEGGVLDSMATPGTPLWQEKVPPKGGFNWEGVGGWPQALDPVSLEGPFSWEVKEEPWRGLPRHEPPRSILPPPPLYLAPDTAPLTGMELWDPPTWGPAHPPGDSPQIPHLEGASERGLWLKEDEARAVAQQALLTGQRADSEAQPGGGFAGLQTPSGDWSASWETGQATGLDLSRSWPDNSGSTWPPPAPTPSTLWVPTEQAPPPPEGGEPSNPPGGPPGKPPLPPSFPRLRQLKGLRTLSVPPVRGDGSAPPGAGIESPFAVPESPTVVQVLREMHSDAGSRPSSAASIPEGGEKDGLQEEPTEMEEASPAQDCQKQGGKRRAEERQGGHMRSASQHLPRFEILDCSPEWDFSVGGAKVRGRC
jgi:hypothetical protein